MLPSFEGTHQSTTYTKPARATEETHPGCFDQMELCVYYMRGSPSTLRRESLLPTYDQIVWGSTARDFEASLRSHTPFVGRICALSTAAYNIYSLRKIVQQGMLCEQAGLVHSDAVSQLFFWPITRESRLRFRSTHP